METEKWDDGEGDDGEGGEGGGDDDGKKASMLVERPLLGEHD